MSRIHRKYDRKAACPFMSTPDQLVQCVEEDCWMWVTEKNDEFDGCAMPRMFQNVTALLFEVKGDR